ncbi:MAG: hypothetical protein J6X18_13675 [Bacteroidales bacterium]|nr:hypothetical protein [Bacteroidales bacterium]
MEKYKIRVYLTTYVDIEVEANELMQAYEKARLNSDAWFAADNQILENVEFSDAEWIETSDAKDNEMQILASFKDNLQN